MIQQNLMVPIHCVRAPPNTHHQGQEDGELGVAGERVAALLRFAAAIILPRCVSAATTRKEVRDQWGRVQM